MDPLSMIPLAVGMAALVPTFLKKNELQKIEQVFRNLKFCVNENNELKYPEIINTNKNENYNLYRFRMPLGLALTENLTEKLSDTLGKTLNRNVMIHDAKSIMLVYVFKTNLPDKWSYENLPEPEGEDKNEWIVPIGKSYKEMVWHNFDHIPHMTVAGMTRYGKTVLLKNIVTYLVETHPDDVEFYVIDLKGGLEFNRYQQLKQFKAVASNVEEAYALLSLLSQKIIEDMQYFKSNYYTNIANTNIKTRRFIIVDEGAELAPDKSDDKDIKKIKGQCQAYLSNVARVAGALGYKLVFATQYPTQDTLPRQIKQNSDAKISFRLPTGYASEVAIDEHGAEKLEFKGRAIYRTHDRKIVQVPLLEDRMMWKRLEGYKDNANQNTNQVESVDENFIKFE